MEDPKVYKLFAKGLTVGIFQFESAGMREFLKKLQPKSIDAVSYTHLTLPTILLV